ncbi:hypothetical protein Pfo_021265 [Paulownia fortunei]|nr:hypothetical protein Pfo_021265 [Paulownia fortunei]
MIEGGVTPLHTPEELKAMGFHLIVHPLTSPYPGARAMLHVLKTLKDSGTTREHLHKMATFEEFNQLVNLESWFELEARFSNSKTVSMLEDSYGFKAMIKSKDLIKGMLCMDGENLEQCKLLDGGSLFAAFVQAYSVWIGCANYYLLRLQVLSPQKHMVKSALSDHLKVCFGEYVPLKTKDVQLDEYHV